MSLEQYQSWAETLHLLGSPANAASLARAIKQDQAGQAKVRKLAATD